MIKNTGLRITAVLLTAPTGTLVQGTGVSASRPRVTGTLFAPPPDSSV